MLELYLRVKLCHATLCETNTDRLSTLLCGKIKFAVKANFYDFTKILDNSPRDKAIGGMKRNFLTLKHLSTSNPSIAVRYGQSN